MEKKRRIFISIDLPEELKERLERYKKEHFKIPAKWVKKENLHITLVFLGYLNSIELEKTLNVTNEVAQRHPPFSLTLKEINYFPQTPIPRMIWVNIEESNELKALYQDLRDSLKQAINFKPEREEFVSHITLARIKKWEFKRINPEEREDIYEKISFSFLVKSIEIQESILKREGPQYKVLKTCFLK